MGKPHRLKPKRPRRVKFQLLSKHNFTGQWYECVFFLDKKQPLSGEGHST